MNGAEANLAAALDACSTYRLTMALVVVAYMPGFIKSIPLSRYEAIV